MEVLKETYRRNGYSYHLMRRTAHVVLFRQADGQRTVAYEVGYVKVQKEEALLPNGNRMPAGERFWGNEDIGRTAWSIQDEGRAEQRFVQLARQHQSLVESPDNSHEHDPILSPSPTQGPAQEHPARDHRVPGRAPEPPQVGTAPPQGEPH